MVSVTYDNLAGGSRDTLRWSEIHFNSVACEMFYHHLEMPKIFSLAVALSSSLDLRCFVAICSSGSSQPTERRNPHCSVKSSELWLAKL